MCERMVFLKPTIIPCKMLLCANSCSSQKRYRWSGQQTTSSSLPVLLVDAMNPTALERTISNNRANAGLDLPEVVELLELVAPSFEKHRSNIAGGDAERVFRWG